MVLNVMGEKLGDKVNMRWELVRIEGGRSLGLLVRSVKDIKFVVVGTEVLSLG